MTQSMLDRALDKEEDVKKGIYCGLRTKYETAQKTMEEPVHPKTISYQQQGSSIIFVQ